MISQSAPRITGTLSEIVANRPEVQTLADATDIPGVNLEFMVTAEFPNGAWFGNYGVHASGATLRSLPTAYIGQGTAMEGGTLVRYGGVGVGWLPIGVDESLTLAELLATTGSTGATAKCLDPMFGPMGAMFDWAQSLGKWVPRNARIYGSGVGTVYTASAGDINTQVQVGTLDIPESLIFAGISVAFRFSYTRPSSGAAGTVAGRLHHPVTVNNIIESTIGQDFDITTQGFARHQYGELFRTGARTGSSGFGGQNRRTLPKDGSEYKFVAQFNAPTAGMAQTLTELYAELSYGG